MKRALASTQYENTNRILLSQATKRTILSHGHSMPPRGSASRSIHPLPVSLVKKTAERSPRNPRGNDTHTNTPPRTRRKEFPMENGARARTHERPNRSQRNPHGSDTCTNAPFRHRKNAEGPSCAPEAATTTCWQKTVANPPPRATESRPPPAAATPIIALQRCRASSH